MKLDILLNGSPVDALASIVHRSKAQRVGRDAVEKLKKIIDRQMFEVGFDGRRSRPCPFVPILLLVVRNRKELRTGSA